MQFLILGFILILNTACAQISRQEKMNAVITSQIDRTLKGSIIAIHENEKTTYLTFGESGKDNSPIDENTIFEIGSITKTFTGLLYAIAIQNKILTLETTVKDILPKLKGQKTGDIKLLDLTTQRSGLPRLPCNFFNERYVDDNPYAHFTENDLMEGLQDQAFLKDQKCSISQSPTADINYSNFGSALLGYLLAKKMKTTYPELLKKWILQPLKLENTYITVPTNQKNRLAQGFNHKLEPSNYWGRDILYGAGAIYSTASDLIKYAMAHLYPEKTSIPEALVMTQKIQFEKEQSRIGINWFITPGGSIWHSGMTGGFSSMLKIYLKNKNIVLGLANSATDIQCLIESYEEIECTPN
jgi:serine-type D-Ala-D-Ala carboxypeptidase/endopeptidase